MKKMIRMLAALLALAVASCGGERLFSVTGKVMFHGAPAAGATVYFQRRGEVSGPVVLGTVQDDGSFELVSGALGKGAPVGAYDILIAWRKPGTNRKDCCERPSDWLEGRYNDYRSPQFHAVIEAKVNVLPAFELK